MRIKMLNVSVLAAILLAPVAGYADSYICPSAADVNNNVIANKGLVNIVLKGSGGTVIGTLTGNMNPSIPTSDSPYVFTSASAPTQADSGITVSVYCIYYSNREPTPIPLTTQPINTLYQGSSGSTWETTNPYITCYASDSSACKFEDKA